MVSRLLMASSGKRQGHPAPGDSSGRGISTQGSNSSNLGKPGVVSSNWTGQPDHQHQGQPQGDKADGLGYPGLDFFGGQRLMAKAPNSGIRISALSIDKPLPKCPGHENSQQANAHHNGQQVYLRLPRNAVLQAFAPPSARPARRHSPDHPPHSGQTS